jgi:hypothetical protein
MTGSDTVMALSSYFSPFFSYSHNSGNKNRIIPLNKRLKPRVKHKWKSDSKEGPL